MIEIVVIGAGAAGLMAAGTAAAQGARVTVLERNEKAGKKLYITGKGRCNVTNVADGAEFLKSVVTNEKFLYGALHTFSPRDTVDLLERYGVPTKVERGGRVFPVSDKSSDVIRALVAYCEEYGVCFRYGCRVEAVEKSKGGFAVRYAGASLDCDCVILATGGLSYPTTGSTGDGYTFAKRLGHTIVPPVPALAPIGVAEDVKQLEGLSLKNVRLTAVDPDGAKVSEFGELLFTADGISGPVALTLSSMINRKQNISLFLDLKPALDETELDLRIQADFKKYANKQFKNALGDLLPRLIIDYVVAQSGIDPQRPVNVITRAQRAELLRCLKRLPFTVTKIGGFERAVVTAGGVDVREVNPKTMESKLVSGLYLVGEMLDVDALTGGYNIQIALSTGYVGGKAGGL